MRYMGGKMRQGKKIAEVVKKVLGPDQPYVEPFCGALGVATNLGREGLLLSDVSRALIRMWQDAWDGKIEYPAYVSYEEWVAVRAKQDPEDWRTAFYGFGCAFSGRFYGAYARDDVPGNTPRQARDSIKKKLAKLKAPVFRSGSYSEIDIPPKSFIYCDPPYQGRIKVHDFDTFDYDHFWQWCRNKVAEGHIVVATEFVVPKDFVVLHDFGDTIAIAAYSKARHSTGTTEVLVCHESQAHLWGIE